MVKIGLDMGTSSLKVSAIDEENVVYTSCINHHGLIKESLKSLIQNLPYDEFYFSVTGSNSLLLSKVMNIKVMDEIPSIVEGTRFLYPEARSVIEIGSQSSRFISDVKDKAPFFNINEHCAGGTGSFFEDQMSRLGLSIEDYNSECSKAKSIPRLSGRCSVFAKTDIIHRQQEGCSTPDILLGLCYAMIRNYKAVIVKDAKVNLPILFSGGVTKNEGVKKAILDVFKIDEKDLVISDFSLFTSSIGASLKAENELTKDTLLKAIDDINLSIHSSSLPALKEEGEEVKEPKPDTTTLPPEGVVLGIDIGSTSTDLVLLDKEGKLLYQEYLRTSGNPEEAVKIGLKEIEKRFGITSFITSGITGSGRTRLGKLMGVDFIKDEITSQARCASFINKDCDTVFEIGGQDSKYISLKNGEVVDFQMNKICAAGTGSFIEEQASRMNIPLKDFGPLSLTSKNPTNLGERCTVFIETAIASSLSQNTPLCDIASGLCHSIVQNYLHKVVGNKRVGEHIVLQGGVNYNSGIVAAFKSVYGERVEVSPYFPISGAVGVALIALNEYKGKKSTFHGFEKVNEEDKEIKRDTKEKDNKAFWGKGKKLLLEGYDGKLDPTKKTVGIPYALMIHKLFPMAHTFFKNLGYNVLLSDESNEDTIRRSQENASGETCYPVKLIYGHMKELMEKGVDYIFMPTVRTMKHEVSKVKNNYGCVYMQTAPLTIAKSLGLEEKGITLLNPVFDLDFGKKAMVMGMLSLGKILHKPKPVCLKALIPGAMKIRRHTAMMEEMGVKMLNSLKKNEKALVLITRNYGLSDPVLNMGIPQMLLSKGYKVLTLSHLPAHNIDISDEYPNVYYPFGQHIISGIKIVKNHPNLYAICLNNHGCGPDSMLSQIVKTEMKDKPFLQIEVDEHFSKVGVITRIEAFLNSLENRETVTLPESFDMKDVTINKVDITKTFEKTSPLYLPHFGNYNSFLSLFYKEKGIETKLLQDNKVDELRRGREETQAKEYLPFTYLLDSVLTTAENERGDIDILIPETQGAEADGLYARSIRSVLDRRGLKNIHLVSPTLEELHKEENLSSLIRSLLMGDLSYLTKIDSDKLLSFEEIKEKAKEIKKEKIGKKRIAATGTPLSLTTLDSNIIEDMEKEGYIVIRNSITEYLLFLWMDRAIEEKNKKLIKKLTSFIKITESLAKVLSDISPFSNDFSKLLKEADISLPRFSGGNGRYRWAKAIDMSKTFDGVLTFSPRYENTQTVLEMRRLNSYCKCPLFSLELDGDWDEASLSRLHSFLYYC